MSSIRRALFALAWWSAWWLEAAGRGITYAAAGALTRTELAEAITVAWDRYGVDQSFVDSGLLPWEQALYAEVLRAHDRILVVGCGAGRDVIALLRRGHEVEGLDPAAGPLAAARQTLARLGLHARLHAGRIETAALSGVYDVVVFSAYAYSYVPESRSRVAVLDRIRHALAPGGRVVLPYLPAERPPSRWIGLARLVAWLTRSDWRPERGDRLWVSITDRRFVQFEHQFEPAELEAEVRAAGFRIITHRRHGPLAERLCVLTA